MPVLICLREKSLNEDLLYRGSSANLSRLHTSENKVPFWDFSQFRVTMFKIWFTKFVSKSWNLGAHLKYIILAEIPVIDWVQKKPSKIALSFMKVTASTLLNVLEQNICKLLLPGSSQKFMIYSNIPSNSILVYPNKNIVNNHVGYKSISILITHKKGISVLYKRGASFIPDIILFFISIFWFINWSSHHIDCGFCTY